MDLINSARIANSPKRSPELIAAQRERARHRRSRQNGQASTATGASASVALLPERVASTREEIRAARVIAEATGTVYIPAHQCTRREGGGVIYDYTERRPRFESVGGPNDRAPLQVTRDPRTGLYEIS